MRIVMMGSGPFAVPTLQAICDSSHDVIQVVSRPLRASSSRKRLPPHPVQALAEQMELPTASPESINDPEVVAWLRSLAADLFMVCDYGQILSSECLTASKHGGFNLHASLLPKYRGAAPINWALYHGEQTTGVTVIQMTPGLDAGPWWAQAATPIGPDEDAIALESRLAAMGATLVLQAIDRLQSGDVAATPQSEEQATKAPRLRAKHGRIDWRRTAAQIENQIRAFKPWPRAFTHWLPEGREPVRLILASAAVEPGATNREPGVALTSSGDELSIATSDGALRLIRVQPAGKREMSVREFLNGHAVAVGDRFGEPTVEPT